MTETLEQKKKELDDKTWEKIKKLMNEPDYINVSSTTLLSFGNKYQQINAEYSDKLKELKK